MEKLYETELTYSELLLLDSKVSEVAQAVIESAKKEQSIGFEIPAMNEIIVASLKKGKLTWTFKIIRNCRYCNKNYDYYKYPRTGRNHRKGETDYSKPRHYSGIAFNEGFITLVGCGDMCVECANKNNVINRLIDYILTNDLKIEIQKNEYRKSAYKKDAIRICYECKQEMQESEMGLEHAIMGGVYPGRCPHCGARSLFLGKTHEITDKFVMQKVTE